MADTLADAQGETLLETMCYAETLVHKYAGMVERARFEAQGDTLIVVLVEMLVSTLA